MSRETIEPQDRGAPGFAHPRVIVVGNLTIDDVVLPDGTTRMSRLGGNCLYAALGARLWQPAVGIVTRRGDDFPADLTNALRSLRVATDGMVDIAGPTVRNWLVYEASGERHWLYRTPRERSREVAVQAQDVPRAWLIAEPPPVVHIAAMPIDVAEAVVDTVRRLAPCATITLDTHEDYVVDYRQRLRALAARVDAFLPSRAELADLVGYDDPRRALASLMGLSTSLIVIKMGADGALVWEKAKGALYEVESTPGPVVDVTGAGDAFCGGFAAGLSLGFDALNSAKRGSIAAAYAIADFGSLQLAQVNPAEAQSRLLADGPVVHLLPPSPSQEEGAGADRAISSAADTMREEIAAIPRLLAEQFEALAGPLYALASALTTAGIEHLYMVGCGDSAFASMAAALAFQKHAGIHAEGIHALDFARYQVRYLPKRSAVLCISISGKVGRTIEAAIQARRFGHRVLVLTGTPDSPLAREAEEVILLSVPTLGYAPGTSTYLAILVALLDLALAWGEERGNPSGCLSTQLRRVPDLARQTLEAGQQAIRALAEKLVQHEWFTFLGAGPNLGSAYFGAAKLFEGPQRLGIATNIEEWAHEQYFISGAGTPVFVIAPGGAAFDRAGEILSELRYIGADSVWISDLPPPVPATTLPLAPGLPEEYSPLLVGLPLSLFAYFLTRASGQQRFEFPSPQAAQEHYETIHHLTQGEPA